METIAMRITCATALVCVAVGGTVSSALAGLTSGFVLHSVEFDQTSDAVPAERVSRFLGRVTPTTPQTDGFLVTPLGPPAMTLVFDSLNNRWDTVIGLNTFATRAELDAVFPPGGTYMFEAYEEAGGQSTLGATPRLVAYPNSIPQLTNYSLLQGLDTTQPTTITWTGMSFPWGFYGKNQYLVISSAGGDVFNQYLPESQTSLTLPAGTFAPNTSYNFELTWFSDVPDYSVPMTFRYSYSTYGSIQTAAVPEPASIAALNMGCALLMRRPRRARRGS